MLNDCRGSCPVKRFTGSEEIYPHSRQNSRVSGFWVWQFGHSMLMPSILCSIKRKKSWEGIERINTNAKDICQICKIQDSEQSTKKQGHKYGLRIWQKDNRRLHPYAVYCRWSTCELETQVLLAADAGFFDKGNLSASIEDINAVERMLMARIKP